MNVIVDGKKLSVKENSSVREALKEAGLNPEIFIVKRNGEIIHENERLAEGDIIKLIKVISGG